MPNIIINRRVVISGEKINVSISASSTSINYGDSVTFTATTTTDSPSYQWKINGYNVGTDSATFITTILSDGDVVTCEVYSGASTYVSNSITMSVVFTWVNATAEALWDEILVQNPTIDTQDLYDCTNGQTMTAIDVFFTTGNSDGWLADLVNAYLFIGGDADSHSIDAINISGATYLSYFGTTPPTQSYIGMTCDGIDQYASMNNDPSSDGTTTTSAGFTYLIRNTPVDTGAFITAMGSANSATQREVVGNAATTRYLLYQTFQSATAVTTTNSNLGSVITATRTASNRADIYVAGSTIGNTTSAGGSLPNKPTFLMAYNNNDIPASFREGNILIALKHRGLNSAKALSLKNAISLLQLTLGNRAAV